MKSIRRTVIESERKKGNNIYTTYEMKTKKSSDLITTLPTLFMSLKKQEIDETVPKYNKSATSLLISNITTNVYSTKDRQENIAKFGKNHIFTARASKTTEKSKLTPKYVPIDDVKIKTNLSTTMPTIKIITNALNTSTLYTNIPKLNSKRPKKEFIDVNRLIKIGGTKEEKGIDKKEKEINKKMKEDLLLLFGPTTSTTKNGSLDSTDVFQELEEAFNLS